MNRLGRNEQVQAYDAEARARLRARSDERCF